MFYGLHSRYGKLYHIGENFILPKLQQYKDNGTWQKFIPWKFLAIYSTLNITVLYGVFKIGIVWFSLKIHG